MADLRLQQLAKSYGNNQVLRQIDLHIQDGEFMVFVGPSGCGKSTLLRMIAGLEDIDEGDLMIGGMRVNDTPPAQRGLAMVFQSYALYPHMTVFENMAFSLSLSKMPKAEISDAVHKAAAALQSRICWIVNHATCQVDKDNGLQLVALLFVNRNYFCLTSHCLILMPAYAYKCV